MGHTEPLAFRIHTLAATGNGVAAKAGVCRNQQRHVTNPVPPLHRALAVLGMGDREAAWELLDEGFAEHDVRLISCPFNRAGALWGEGGYARILERAGLPNQVAKFTLAGGPGVEKCSSIHNMRVPQVPIPDLGSTSR